MYETTLTIMMWCFIITASISAVAFVITPIFGYYVKTMKYDYSFRGLISHTALSMTPGINIIYLAMLLEETYTYYFNGGKSSYEQSK